MRDIAVSTVNRWSHGYAWECTTLWDPKFAPNERPCVIGRQPFGRITIANSDAGAKAYTDVAIGQAWRAVGEIHSKSQIHRSGNLLLGWRVNPYGLQEIRYSGDAESHEVKP